ncbi:hypothetical protein NYR55_01045 [Sphingomonas sp. BGYR3]|uniref:hypothetical protein n=1 Tax=Sphingomonas sp. BGYR3 TaxID=2975483 RepID=UPI0021A429AA|nr:hypothetical protein [Sphingomonas sp. BGYR3]MDG5487216.1 hypothetical protein [Sphingomonas sp. BGYR3]
MKKNRLIARTATLALIATLAAPAIAQDIAPAPAPVQPVQAPSAPTTSAPTTTAPVIIRQAAPAPTQTTAAPSIPAATPQSGPSAAQSAPSATVAPEALAQVEQEQAAAREAAQRNREAQARRSAANTAASDEPARAEAAPAAEVAPPPTLNEAPAVDPAVQSPPPVAATPAPEAAPPADSGFDAPATAESSTDWTPWIVGVAGIGAAFALLAWAATRRRRAAPDPVVANREVNRPIEPKPRPIEPRPMTVATPQAATVEPVQHAPAMAATATPLVAHGVSPATHHEHSAVLKPGHEGMGRHERAALAGPTADNPFLTRRARLKRARFYDERERMGLVDAAAAAPARTPAAPAAQPVGAAPRQEVERPRVIKQVGWPGSFKPAFGQS